ncbi:MAG: cadherin-like domain-containing protein [Planctomycetota bacterium]
MRFTQATEIVFIESVQMVVYHSFNTAPVADANGPYDVDEGGNISLDATGSSDAEDANAALTFEWDLDNDGDFDDAIGDSPNFSAANLDGPFIQTVGLRVTDTGGLSDTDTTSVIIDNVAPTANDDGGVGFTTDEDTSFTTADVRDNDTDPSPTDPLTVSGFDTTSTQGLVLNNGDGTFDYDPNGQFESLGAGDSAVDTFEYTVIDDDGGSDTATVFITVAGVNDAPMANDDAYDATEDTPLVVGAPGVLANDTDADGDPLSVMDPELVTASNGSLALSSDGSFTYDPNSDYCGPDSFTYMVADDPPAARPLLDSHTATVSITVTCVNDPPVVTDVDPSAQTSDYSDYIGTVTITVEDVDDTSTTLSESNEPPLSAAGLSLTSTGCTPVITESPDEDGSICTWTYDGQVLDPGDNVHGIVFTPNDGDADGATGTHTLTVQPEDATVVLDSDNPIAEMVETDGGNSGIFYMYFAAWETDDPDFPHDGTAQFGDLNEMVPYMTLIPVGPGGPVDGICDFIPPLPVYPGEGYSQVALFECEFDDVPVNTYEVIAAVDGASDTTRYYAGSDEGVFVVFDPSLGFTTGGGWFIWPGSEDPDLLTCGPDGYAGDRTNFGFNMKYNKKRKNVQGSLLLMRHTVDTACLGAGNYKVKSNALDGLAIGEATDAGGNYGWAAFSGKATYREPGLDTEGNHTFLTYVEDHGDQGCGQDPVDEFWIEVRDKDGIVVLEINGPNSDPAGDNGSDGDDEPIMCGQIIVPHENQEG